MKTIDEINRDNLKLLVREYDSVVAVADLIGCSSSQYSQWMNGSENSGTGKPRGMRASSARRIEKACGKPLGWMDQAHDDDPRERELVDIFSALDDRGRETLLTVARSLQETGARAPS